MKHSYIDFEIVPYLSKKDISYQTDFKTWKEFAKYEPKFDNFETAIIEKSKQSFDRELLCEVLSKQYDQIETDERVRSNITKLSQANTFTIVTAHQPSLLTGPLYYIFKICSIINLCDQLQQKYPLYNFVPVFVSGGEDHDFEEVNHLRLFNHTHVWTHSHGEEPVGRMDLKGLSELVDEIQDKLRSDGDAHSFLTKVKSHIENSEVYSELVFKYVNDLFSKYGLVFMNMDTHSFKSAFVPILKQEIFERPSKELVNLVQNNIAQNGFKSQAFARDINVFFITENGQRRRIEYSDNRFHIVGTDISYSQQSMEKLIDRSPGQFSPNVVLRPIYQEFLLPNLAYVGGGGEIAYWLERKTQFEHFQIPFPMLIRRNSVYLTDPSVKRNLKKLQMNITDFFNDEHEIITSYINHHEQSELNLEEDKAALEACYEKLKLKVSEIDKSLTGRIEAELAKSLKTYDQLEFRLRKTLKDKHQINIDRIHATFRKIFPESNLQERKTNFLEFLDKYGFEMIDELVELLNPMDKRFLVVDLD